ncbi:hypothetical protein AAHC03_024245 [Spirometra sp. Aus1]
MVCKRDSAQSITAASPDHSGGSSTEDHCHLQQQQQSNASSRKSLDPENPDRRASGSRRSTGRSEEKTDIEGSSKKTTQPPSLGSSKVSVGSEPSTLESKKSSKLPDRDEFNQLQRSIKELAEEFEAESRQIKNMLQESLGLTAEDQAASVVREQALSVIAEDELSDAMTLLGNSLEYLVRGARQEKMDLLSALRKSMTTEWTTEQKTEQLQPQPPPSTIGYPSSGEMSELLRQISGLAAELRSQNERISQTFQSRSLSSLPPPPPGEFKAEAPPEQLPLASPFFGLQQGIVGLTKLIQEDSERLSCLLQPTTPRPTDASAADITYLTGFGNPLQQEVMATGRSVMSRLHELSSEYTQKAGGEEAVVASTPLIVAVKEVTKYVETLARNVHDLKQQKSNERRAHYAQSLRQALDDLTGLVHDLNEGLGELEQTRFQECINQQQELVARLTIPDPALMQVLKQVKDSVHHLAAGVMEMRERQEQLLDRYSQPISLPFELGINRAFTSNGEHPHSVLTDVHGVEEEAMLKSLREIRESVAYIGREIQEADLNKPPPVPKVPEVPPTDPNVLKALSALRESVKSIHRRRRNMSSSSTSTSDTLHIK